MPAVNGELVEQIRQLVGAARQAGQPAPGRPTLARLTGATDHAVRKAMAKLEIERVNAGEPGDVDDALNDESTGTEGTGANDRPAIGDFGDEASSTGHQCSTRPSTPQPAGGRLVAWTGFVFGSVMSIAANVLHAWLPAGHAPAGWSPGIAPQVGAAVWPVGLMLAVEALSRIRWPKGLGWGLARFAGAGAVAAGSAIISYGHLRDLLLAWSYGPVAAAVGPLVLDGLMVVCGFALLAMSRASAGEDGDGRP